MSRKICILFSLLCGFIANAQEHPYETHTLGGIVYDLDDSSMVPYAVIYFPELQIGTTTDTTGKFIMYNLPGEFQQFTITRVGYESTVYTAQLQEGYTWFGIRKGSNELSPVSVVGTQTQASNQSTSLTSVIGQQEMRSHGALSISDGVSRLPGVTQLNTGVGISKPVIRGLYGNRIQTIVMGMRFDNQQWQDEHGLGLADIGVDRVQVIKGPLSLVYGSEAMGGVINIIEEKPAFNDSVAGDVSLRAFTNTYGASVDAGIKVSRKNYFWRIRAGSESHADYSDGNNKRVQNSRFDGHVAKGTFGFYQRKWSCVNNYLFSKSDFGFIMDNASYLAPDERWSRDFEDPHHTVFINLFTTQNTIYFYNALLRINGGGHVNRRMEDEGGGGISLDMQLVTATLHVQLEKIFKERVTVLTGIQSQYQNNVNYGWRKIVPDANIAEGSAYAFFKYVGSKEMPIVVESGARFDLRHIETFETGTLNSGQYALPTVSKLYTAFNGSLGMSMPFGKYAQFRMNITTGYRSPNLAELSSSGVHEGTLRFEVGNVNMGIENNLCAEASLELNYHGLELSGALFTNRFKNYIYLTPTAEEWFGFRVYRFIQTDAVLAGGEVILKYTPEFFPSLSVEADYSSIRALTDSGYYLPFIPANRLQGNIRYTISKMKSAQQIYIRTGTQHYFPQSHPAQFETATNGYTLFDAGAGATFSLKKNRSLALDIACNNLLNEVYYDHLSRFKEFNIYNIGRNITLNLKYSW